MSLLRGTANVVFWISVGVNVVAMVGNLTQQQYGPATVQTIVLVVLTAWLPIAPKIHARLDARLAEATAQRRMAELMLEQFERLRRQGELQIEATVMEARDRATKH